MCFLDLFYDSAFLFNDKSCYFPSAHSFWTTGWSGPNLWRLTMVCEQIRQCRVLYSLMGFIIDLFINIFHGSKYGRYFRKSRYKEHFFFLAFVSNWAPHDSARWKYWDLLIWKIRLYFFIMFPWSSIIWISSSVISLIKSCLHWIQSVKD